MKRLIYSERSLADLGNIIDFIARDKPEVSIAFAEKIIEVCELIAKNPEIGSRHEDLKISMRLFSYRTYGIHYRNLDDNVRIERVLHGSLDTTQQSFD